MYLIRTHIDLLRILPPFYNNDGILIAPQLEKVSFLIEKYPNHLRCILFFKNILCSSMG